MRANWTLNVGLTLKRARALRDTKALGGPQGRMNVVKALHEQ